MSTSGGRPGICHRLPDQKGARIHKNIRTAQATQSFAEIDIEQMYYLKIQDKYKLPYIRIFEPRLGPQTEYGPSPFKRAGVGAGIRCT